MKSELGMADSIKAYGIPWEAYEEKLDQLADMAFDDQCTGANPRYPLMQELRQLFVDAYHGRPLQLEEPVAGLRPHFVADQAAASAALPIHAKL